MFKNGKNHNIKFWEGKHTIFGQWVSSYGISYELALSYRAH